MAVALTLKFQANRDALFAKLTDIVFEAGYLILDTDEAAKKVQFQAKASGFAWEQIITASIVGGPDDTTALLTLHVDSTQLSLLEEGYQNKIIESLVTELAQYFPIASLPPNATPPPPQKTQWTPYEVMTCLVVVILIVFGAMACYHYWPQISQALIAQGGSQRPEIHISVLDAQMAMETPQHTTSGNSRFIYLTVGAGNTTDQTQEVNPLYFTLSTSEGYTVNPHDDTYALPNYFQAMSLPPGGVTKGVLIFLAPADASYVLHFDSGLTTPVDTNVSFSSG